MTNPDSIPAQAPTPDGPPHCAICGKVSTRLDIDGFWWPPCEHAKRDGIGTLVFSQPPSPALPGGEGRAPSYPPITLDECDSFERHAVHGAKVDVNDTEYTPIQAYDLVRFCHTVRALKSVAARDTRDAGAVAPVASREPAERGAVERVRFSHVRIAVEHLRDLVERNTGPGLPLRDALIGQHSDAAFYSAWEANKAGLRDVLNALDEALPVIPLVAAPAGTAGTHQEER